jgi:hypothetical protein
MLEEIKIKKKEIKWLKPKKQEEISNEKFNLNFILFFYYNYYKSI